MDRGGNRGYLGGGGLVGIGRFDFLPKSYKVWGKNLNNSRFLEKPRRRWENEKSVNYD